MRKKVVLAWVLGVSLTGLPWSDASACRCGWGGPFLAMAKSSAIVVRAQILAYNPSQTAMDVEILQVIKGSLSQKILRIYGDNGMLCRPIVTNFPLQSHWLLVLNGMGSMPDFNEKGGYAISACGSYWLKLENDVAVGNIRGAKPDVIERMPLQQVIKFILP